ncbi:hypothetical protein V1477_020807, partial [Vespula maculifrons]
KGKSIMASYEHSIATYGGHTEASRDNDVVSLQCIPMLVAFWCSERVETSSYGTHETLAAGYGRSTYASTWRKYVWDLSDFSFSFSLLRPSFATTRPNEIVVESVLRAGELDHFPMVSDWTEGENIVVAWVKEV